MINDHLSTWLFDDIDWNAISHRRILIRNTIDLPGTSRLRRWDGSEPSISNEVTKELDFVFGHFSQASAGHLPSHIVHRSIAALNEEWDGGKRVTKKAEVEPRWI